MSGNDSRARMQRRESSAEEWSRKLRNEEEGPLQVAGDLVDYSVISPSVPPRPMT